MNKEIIICAAVLGADGVKLIRGHRHHDAIRTLHGIPGYEKDHVPPEHQGFITSGGRFVGRKEALKIQREAGMPCHQPSGYRGDELYSEDLY